MRIRRYVSAAEFLKRVQGTLEREEVTNNLSLGLLLRLAREPEPDEGERRPFYALAEDDGHVAFVMVMTPPHNVIVYGQGEDLDAAIDAAVSYLLREGPQPPGVIGPREISTEFASSWHSATGCEVAVQMNQMIYRLDRVDEVAFSSGEFIRATPAHVDLLAEWMVGFSEVTHERLGLEDARVKVQDTIAAGRLYLWCDGEPVSMAWKVRPTTRGIVVSGVYTPPAYRRRGYATSCVASLSQLLLDEGYEYCALYADLSNPISNSIYRKMGYRPVRASTAYSFGPAD